MMRFTEETGAALDSVTFLVFGAVLLGPVFEHVSWQIALYAVLKGRADRWVIMVAWPGGRPTGKGSMPRG
jgi:hypothetical protein